MDVPGLCVECHRPGILTTCALCGAHVCPSCQGRRHDCAALGRRVLGGAWGEEDSEP